MTILRTFLGRGRCVKILNLSRDFCREKSNLTGRDHCGSTRQSPRRLCLPNNKNSTLAAEVVHQEDEPQHFATRPSREAKQERGLNDRGEMDEDRSDAVTPPRCVRRRIDPRFPPGIMVLSQRPLVEYDLVDADQQEDGFNHVNAAAADVDDPTRRQVHVGSDSEPTCVVEFLTDKAEEDRLLWISDRCYLRRPMYSAIDPGQRDPWIPVCTYRTGNARTLRSPVRLDLMGYTGGISDAWELIPEVDSMLRLVKSHAQSNNFVLSSSIQAAWFPVSAYALWSLIDNAPSGWDGPNPWHETKPRSVTILARLTEEHKRVLAFGCHPNVELKVDLNVWTRDGNGIQVLVNAIRQNACPRHISIDAFLPEDRGGALQAFRALMEAMEGKTRPESLEVYLPHPRLGAGADRVDIQTKFFKLLIPSLPRCRCLQSFTLWDGDRSALNSTFQSLWKPFWDCIGSHPTLRSLTLLACELSTFSAPMIEEMADCLRTTTSLQHLRAGGEDEDDDDFEHLAVLRDRLIPVLRLNRFRPLVALVLRQEDSVRANSFRSLLQDDDIRNVVDYTFFLMTEANGVFVDVLSRRRRARHNRLVPAA